MPARYQQEWGTEFWGFVNAALRPGIAILDVGSGRRPTIASEQRPADVHYAGLDISRSELDAAAVGSYDEQIVAAAETLAPNLVDRFDLIVAWQVLEHVRDLHQAVKMFHRYGRSGCWFVACLSGRNAAFAAANRMLPAAAGKHLVARLRGRPPESVFPAYYDRCDERGLRGVLFDWDEVQIVPLWRGADYFERFPGLLRLYVCYEDWAIKRHLTNLATHYVIAARKGGGGAWND